ncbi:glycosyltransferase [Citreimonas salinaria]|uniref:Glycosyltransferase involved in cell wall bisynthesis n=1 Tax=Citreimonas salinaria TaxID=321339 RepID=A0A1H3HPC9_9RHOB|nr:glycosyltransferase [Citreimonas salinaria]SDY16648.1 Glycosyltransferase involved in cell wall bisynthesis [Citreimonas salinaria]
MDILLIHQNFPGQFKHLAPALARAGHRVTALTCRVKEAQTWHGVRILPYAIRGASTREIHPWLADFETKVLRGHSCHAAAAALKAQGYAPDVICAHHGWGESLFLKDVWPEARLGLYCELYHLSTPDFTTFDPEFPPRDPATDALRLRLKNLNNRLHAEVMDAGLSPTHFQAGTYPDPVRERITVAHDGVDTGVVRPDPGARLPVTDTVTLTPDDEVVTFINRNLEPYRGYHVFMRALPEILRTRPRAHVVLIGAEGTSYGSAPPKGQTWKQIFLDEVRPRIPEADMARVHFLGRVPYDRYLSMLQASSVHVYLTYPFVLSWSLLEAMAAECAILASDTAPVREAISDGETGVLTDFFDRETLVARLGELLDDPDRRARLGRAARQHVLKHYDLETVCLPAQMAWVEHLETLDPRPPRD